MVRIVNLNVWGGNLTLPVAQYLQNVDADVLCLQEVHDAPDTDVRAVINNRDDVVRINFFRELQAYLPRYRAWHFPFAHHWLNDGEYTELPVRYGIATFVRDTFKVLDKKNEFIFGELKTDAVKNGPLPRNVHCLRVLDPETGREYAIAHFHGIWFRGGRNDAPEHDEQTRRLIEALRGFVRPNERFILSGDMNLLPDSHLFVELKNAFGLEDLVTGRGFTNTRTEWLNEPVKEPYADYLLVTPEVEVISFEVAPDRISDHFPLVGKFA